jgi:hypothetical protein
MSITRLQQARQMYALGQLVSKSMDGSRPGYRGDAAYGGGGDKGDGPASGGDGGDRREQRSVATTQGISPTTQSALNVDRSAVSQFSEYGKNVMNQNLTPPSVLGKIGGGIKDYITSGGLIGLGIKGLGNLFDKFTGPKATEYGNLDIPGYNMLNIAGPVTGPPTREGGDGESTRGLYATTNQYTIPTAVEEEGITTLVNNPDFFQRFRGLNETRQDKLGELDPQIIAMINKLYTTPTV